MNVLVLSPIHEDAVVMLRRQHRVDCRYGVPQEELAGVVAARPYEVIVFRSGLQLDRAVLDSAPALELLVRAGSGTDNIDFDVVRARGIEFVNIPGPGAQAVAELTFALMLALSRHVVRANELLGAGVWAKHELTGRSLHGKTLGVVGAGNIGTRVGHMGSVWGMRVIGCVGHATLEARHRLEHAGMELSDFDTVLRESDYLSLHLPLNEETRGLIDVAALASMKRGALLVNLARGGVVDEEALREALCSGHLAGAALDVHEHEGAAWRSPLVGLPNVVLTPHIGAGTVETQALIGHEVVEHVNRLWLRRGMAAVIPPAATA